MTGRTDRRTLIAALDAAKAQAKAEWYNTRDAGHAYDTAAEQLEKLGFTEKIIPSGVKERLDYRAWEGPKNATLHTSDELEAIRESARVAERARVLQTVIDGLQLREYGYTAPHEYPMVHLGGGTPVVDRFWADLKTALEVRAEQAAADKRARTEKSVREMTRGTIHNAKIVPDGVGTVIKNVDVTRDRDTVPGPSISLGGLVPPAPRSGSIFGGDFGVSRHPIELSPATIQRLSDALQGAIHTPVVDVRPEKSPTGHTRDISAKPRKKKAPKSERDCA